MKKLSKTKLVKEISRERLKPQATKVIPNKKKDAESDDWEVYEEKLRYVSQDS